MPFSGLTSLVHRSSAPSSPTRPAPSPPSRGQTLRATVATLADSCHRGGDTRASRASLSRQRFCPGSSLFEILRAEICGAFGHMRQPSTFSSEPKVIAAQHRFASVSSSRGLLKGLLKGLSSLGVNTTRFCFLRSCERAPAVTPGHGVTGLLGERWQLRHEGRLIFASEPFPPHPRKLTTGSRATAGGTAVSPGSL